MSNLEKFKSIREYFEKELEEKIKQYKKNSYSKKDINILSTLGLDRVGINISLTNIISDKKEFNINNSPYFEKLVSGYYMGNHYSRLIFNPAKYLYGDNLLNISTKEEFKDSLIKLQDYIKKSYGINIDIMKCTLCSIEANKYEKLDYVMEDYTESLLEMNKKLIKGHFKKKFNLFKDWGELSYVGFGTKNKYIVAYDKSLEYFIKSIGMEEFEKMSPKEIKRICKKYKTPVRIELKLRNSSLWNIVPKDLTLEEFIEDFDYWLKYIYSNTIEESGLNKNNLNKVLEARNKSFIRAFKHILRDHKRGFIGKFLKNHSFSTSIKESIWGLDEFLDIIEKLSENRIQKGNWKRLGKKEFLEMDYQPKLDKKIKELIEKIEL